MGAFGNEVRYKLARSAATLGAPCEFVRVAKRPEQHLPTIHRSLAARAEQTHHMHARRAL